LGWGLWLRGCRWLSSFTSPTPNPSPEGEGLLDWRPSTRFIAAVDATALALTLGLFSAVTLAAANMSVKMGGDILAGRAILSGSAAAMVLPAVFFVPLPDSRVWGALAIAIPAHFAYQLCLIRALQRGELSLVFPIMRGAAPLLTGLFAFAVLRETLSPAAWAGLAIATAAVATFAWPPKGVKLPAHPDRAALGWAAATSVGIALYNVADARGVRLAAEPFTYIVWIFLLDCICIVLTALVFRRRELAETVARQWRFGAAAGALSIASYGSAVYAFSLIEAAKVSALRETSVLFAALMGSLLLGDGFGRRRLIAAAALAAGLMMMEFAG
jgi:drug/metabolite transporter (DMT)-like permease